MTERVDELRRIQHRLIKVDDENEALEQVDGHVGRVRAGSLAPPPRRTPWRPRSADFSRHRAPPSRSWPSPTKALLFRPPCGTSSNDAGRSAGRSGFLFLLLLATGPSRSPRILVSGPTDHDARTHEDGRDDFCSRFRCKNRKSFRQRERRLANVPPQRLWPCHNRGSTPTDSHCGR